MPLLDFLGLGNGSPQAGGPMGLLGLLQGNRAGNAGMLTGIGAGLLSGNNWQSGLAGALQGASQGKAEDKKRAGDAATVAYLKAQGLDPAAAGIVEGNPDIARQMAISKLAPPSSTDDITEYKYASANGYKGGFSDWMQAKRAGSGEGRKFGMAPVYGIGADGQPTILQLGSDGTVVQPTLPPGVRISDPLHAVDTGTGTQMVGTRGGTTGPYIPKDIAGKEIAEAVGGAQGKAIVDAPGQLANANQTLATIDSIVADPGKGQGTGLVGTVARNIPGTPAYNFGSKVDQLKGQTFLQAYGQLRGSGAITDIEGKKAEDAIGRINTGLSGDDFDTAMKELADVVKAGRDRIAARANGGIVAPGGGAPPADGGGGAPAAGGFKVLSVK